MMAHRMRPPIHPNSPLNQRHNILDMSSEFPQDFKSSPTMGTKSHSSSPPPLPHRQTNGESSPPTSASILESNLNKKSSLLQSKVNSSSLASVSSSSSSAFTSASQMVKSSASSQSSSLLSKKSQMLSSLSSSQELKAAENRNYSRSMSLSSSSADRMKMLSHNRGFSMEEVLAEEDSASHQQNGGSSSPIITTPMSPSGKDTPNSPQELRFEQKRVASSSHSKVQTDNYTAEKSSTTNKELKRMQAGDVSYEEKRANSATKARLDSEGFSAEKLSSTLQEQKRLVNSEGVAQQNRKAAHTAVKMSTDEYTAEKVATTKQEERQLFTQGSLHQERNVQTSSKMAFSTKAMSSISSVSKSSNQLEYNNFSSLMGSSDFSLTGSSQRLAITRGFEEDLELLSTGNASAQDVHRITQRITQRMEMCIQKLKNATDDEAEAILGSINDIVRKAWAVPTVGYDLGFNVCNILRNSGGLDILVGHLKSGNDSLEFCSAQVLEQCLSTENRSYIVENGLEKVVSVACSCSTRNSVQHSRIGTGILAHLFKHSEVTCSDVIRMGGLKAILYDCRTSDVETLRHCATALANLSLYGGPENQQAMISSKAPVWLFPLAFHPDDNIKYYACLAIAALVANKEIEAAVLRSGTLDLVEPFVSSHNPEEFATSSVQHVHGQSKNWLLRLVPVLNSKREEARSLAAFHFAMEAGIKKKQGNTSIFNEIGAVDALKKVASSPNAIASKYAAQALLLIGEEVPHKLSQQVPLWTVEDVREWVKQIGFAHYSQQFMNSRVDGDLLLQLTEEMLKEDIGIKNGILRRRFLRELSQLKRLADYSSCDNTNLNNMMQNLGPDFCQYTYPMLQCGVDRNTLKFLSETQLERECGIENSIHRLRISQAILGLVQSYQEEDMDPLDINKKSLDVFVSYRRSNGSQLASLLKVHLQLRGFSVFIDVERLEAGKFDNNLLNSIQQAKYFLLVLTPNALDRCMEDVECKDWVHREIVEALQSQCNIIPILDNFQWPEPDMLPEDMRAVCYFNGVRWIHDYQDACVDKLERFMRGEKNATNEGPFGRLMGSIGGCPGTPGTPSTLSKAPIYQRSASNDSTKGSTCSDKENTNSTTTNHTKPIIEYPPGN